MSNEWNNPFYSAFIAKYKVDVDTVWMIKILISIVCLVMAEQDDM